MKTNSSRALHYVTCFLLICGTMTLLRCVVAQSSPNNMKDHDNLELKIGLAAASRDVIEARAKQFIWAHFAGHREGNLKVTRFSKEGEPSISRYHIVPEASGTSKIDVLVERHLRDRRTHQPMDRTDRFTAYDLQLVISKSGTVVTEIPAGSGLEFFKLCTLRMIDKDGKQITEF